MKTLYRKYYKIYPKLYTEKILITLSRIIILIQVNQFKRSEGEQQKKSKERKQLMIKVKINELENSKKKMQA